jgi:molybdopterin molybdotransferase
MIQDYYDVDVKDSISMITFEKALEIVLAQDAVLATEPIPLSAALGRILARDVVSDIDIPPAGLSAMDGFACRKVDIDKPLKVLETISAGHIPGRQVGPGECSRIMTGAVLPAGADCVVMVEHTRENNGTVCVTRKSGSDNIRHAAEDVHKGDIVIRKGTLITPAIIAVLATAGQNEAPAYKQPKVGIIATGDELVEPAKVPGAAQIRNSNSYQLCSQTLSCGCLQNYYGIAPDTAGATETIIKKALAESDVLLISGGVSAGDFDFVPETLQKLGVEIKFAGVSMKPGKPALFGIAGKKAIFGMPGNPVSTFVVFELFVRPFLLKCMGHRYQPLIVRARLSETLSRKKVDRMEFVPVRFDGDGSVICPEYHGSAHIHSYVSAQGMMCIPEGTDRIDQGSEIQIRIL